MVSRLLPLALTSTKFYVIKILGNVLTYKIEIDRYLMPLSVVHNTVNVRSGISNMKCANHYRNANFANPMNLFVIITI